MNPCPFRQFESPFRDRLPPFGCPFLASRNPDPIRIELKRLLSAGTASKLFPSARGLSVFALRQANKKTKAPRKIKLQMRFLFRGFRSIDTE